MSILFPERYPYQFLEWINLKWLDLRTSTLFRLRYLYYYLLLIYVLLHRFYLFSRKSIDMDSKIFHFDYSRILYDYPTRYVIWISLNGTMIDSFRRYVFTMDKEFTGTILNIFLNRKEYPVRFPIRYFPIEQYRKQCLSIYRLVVYNFQLVWGFEFCSIVFVIWKVFPFLAGKTLSLAMYLLFGFIWNAYAFYQISGLMVFITASAGSYAVLFTLMMRIIFRNLYYSIKAQTNSRRMLRWRRHYIEMMLFFFRLNELQGPSLAWVIICGTPPHAFLSIYVISHPNMPLAELVNNLVGLILVSTYIFIVHGLIAQFCDSIGRPAECLYGHLSGGRVRKNVRQQLLITNLLFDIHSRKSSYGYTYGSTGSINHASFLEFCWVYVGFLLNAYKLIYH